MKTEASEDKILKQLTRNRYYLKFLDKEVLLFAYVLEANSFWALDEKDQLVPTDIEPISKELSRRNKEINDIDKLFNPSNYLISPFNSTDRFMNNEYFLTEHQEEIRTKILKVVESSAVEFMALTGAAGTGKTLLTYDIAKELINRGKEILIVHCGQLNQGQNILLEKYDWDICMPKSSSARLQNQYDVIIVDEAQRIYQTQFDNIREKAKENNMKCIFSFDAKQYLHTDENTRNMSSQISEILTQPIYPLTDKI